MSQRSKASTKERWGRSLTITFIYFNDMWYRLLQFFLLALPLVLSPHQMHQLYALLFATPPKIPKTQVTRTRLVTKGNAAADPSARIQPSQLHTHNTSMLYLDRWATHFHKYRFTVFMLSWQISVSKKVLPCSTVAFFSIIYIKVPSQIILVHYAPVPN